MSEGLWGPFELGFVRTLLFQQIQGGQQMDGQENRRACLNLLEIIHDDGAGYLPRMVF